jgi:hypothetical protein
MLASITVRSPSHEQTVRATFVLLCAAGGACASSGGPTKAYVAPTRESVTAHLEAASGPEDAGLIVIENRSTVPIRVTSVTLHGCENIKQLCDQPYALKERIDGESKRTVMRVSKKISSQGYTLSYSFSWSADSSTSVAVLSALSESGAKEADASLARMKHAEEIQRRDVGFVDEELSPLAIARLGDRIVTLRAEPDSIVLSKGAVLFLGQLRVLAIGAQGESLGRARGRYSFRVEPGAVRFASPDSLIAAAAGRSSVTLTFATPEGSTRSTPFTPVRISLIVR